MKTKILLILLILASELNAVVTQTKTINMNGSNYGVVKQDPNYFIQSSLDVGYITDQTCGRGYIEFNLNGIPTYSTITAAQLRLQANSKFTSYNSSSYIFIKGIDSWTVTGFSANGEWDALLSSITTLYNGVMNLNAPFDLTGTGLINYLSNRKGSTIGMGIINQNETTDGLEFLNSASNLYLKVTYVINTPNAPTGLTISSINSSGFLVSWTDNTAKGYNITCNGQNYYTVNKNYTFTGLNSATQYPITISSVNEAGSSATISINALTKPLPPTNFIATCSSNSINFSWNASSGNIQGYNIYQGSGTTPVSTTSNLNAIISNLNSNTSYTFTIKSYNQSGESDPVTISSTTLKIPAPYNLTESFNSASGYVLSWQYKDGSNLGFKIYELSPQNILLATINPGYTYMYNYLIGNNLNINSMYIYGVSAYDAFSESSITTIGFYTNLNKVKAFKSINDSIINQPSLNIYPNPVTNRLYVDGVTQLFDVLINNLQGQIIKSETKLSNYIDLSELKSGIYIVKIKYGGNEVIKRIIKQ
jgi:hypothetical protein